MLARTSSYGIGILVLAISLCGQQPGVTNSGGDTAGGRENADCSLETQSFALKKQDLTVINTEGGVLFTAGMTIDADGAPNAYAPHNRGLDYTANARGWKGWVALVTDQKGHPILQKRGRYRGYYVSTTSLQHESVSDLKNPKRYIDATRVPYIALPPDFSKAFNISLGDLALVRNKASGRTAYAVFADVGPKGRIGEGSIALAKALGIPSNPRHDSVVDGVMYLVFPGSALPAGKRISARSVRASAAKLYHLWGGSQRLHNCATTGNRQLATGNSSKPSAD